MRNIKTSSLLQILFYEIIICARGHGIMPLLFFNIVINEIDKSEKNIIIGLVFAEIIGIISLLLSTFGNFKKAKRLLFTISTISFTIGFIFLLIFNGVETILFPIITSIPFYLMTLRTNENLLSIESK